MGFFMSLLVLNLPKFNTEWIYSKVDRSSNPKPMTNFIVINPFVVLDIWI